MVNAAANTDRIIPPPGNPCSARHRIISYMLLDVAHIKDAMVNPAADNVNSNRVDSTRPKKPDSGIMINSAIR